MKFDDLKDLTVEELRKKIVQTRAEMFQTKMKHTLGQVQNPIEIREQRRDVARMQTALTRKLS